MPQRIVLAVSNTVILDMKSRSTFVLFFISAFLALGLHWFCFEMRYIWYPPRDAARFWREGYIACASLIIALWIFSPSRLLVALVSTFMMFFPHLYPPGVVANMGRVIDIPTIGFALLIAAMFAGVTELRRRNGDELKKRGRVFWTIILLLLVLLMLWYL